MASSSAQRRASVKVSKATTYCAQGRAGASASVQSRTIAVSPQLWTTPRSPSALYDARMQAAVLEFQNSVGIEADPRQRHPRPLQRAQPLAHRARVVGGAGGDEHTGTADANLYTNQYSNANAYTDHYTNTNLYAGATDANQYAGIVKSVGHLSEWLNAAFG